MGHGAGDAFRAQLPFPEQRALYDLWLELKGDEDMPPRARVSPVRLRAHLPRISLAELRPPPAFLRFRLAGTALRDIYGCDLTGRTLQDPLFAGSRAHWQKVCKTMQTQRRPMAGMLRGPAPERDHLVLFWMRLPLAAADGGIVMLGLDMAMSARRVDAELPELSGMLRDAPGLAASSGGGECSRSLGQA